MKKATRCVVCGVAAVLAAACVMGLALPVRADQVVLKEGAGGYAGCTDTYIDSQSATSNFGTLWYMHLYMYNDAPRRSALVEFDLAGQIPQNAVIDSATLSLWVYQTVDMDSNDYVYVAPFRVGPFRDWVETQATWNVFAGSSYWGTAGCEFVPSDRSGTADCNPLYFDQDSQVNRYYHWTVTSSVQAWYGGTANQGWLMRVTTHDGAAGEGISLNGTEGGLDYRPYLTINYHMIPEPATLGLLGAGLAAAAIRRKRS